MAKKQQRRVFSFERTSPLGRITTAAYRLSETAAGRVVLLGIARRIGGAAKVEAAVAAGDAFEAALRFVACVIASATEVETIARELEEAEG